MTSSPQRTPHAVKSDQYASNIVAVYDLTERWSHNDLRLGILGWQFYRQKEHHPKRTTASSPYCLLSLNIDTDHSFKEAKQKASSKAAEHPLFSIPGSWNVKLVISFSSFSWNVCTYPTRTTHTAILVAIEWYVAFYGGMCLCFNLEYFVNIIFLIPVLYYNNFFFLFF